MNERMCAHMNDIEGYSQVFKGLGHVFSPWALMTLWPCVTRAFCPKWKQKLIPNQIPWRKKTTGFGALSSSHQGLLLVLHGVSSIPRSMSQPGGKHICFPILVMYLIECIANVCDNIKYILKLQIWTAVMTFERVY